jgi:hypothetical protein
MLAAAWLTAATTALLAGTPAPGACAGPMDQATQALNDQIDQGLGGTTVQHIPVHIGTGYIDDGI